ncbi:hypothetical protein [Streptomyces sp. NPDC057428]|uniref:hypothetical protein n=1 Tax=Streptomyces sp. NPDC057428 TaxID=3346129 RepID=UPI0036CF93F1
MTRDVGAVHEAPAPDRTAPTAASYRNLITATIGSTLTFLGVPGSRDGQARTA